MNIKLGKVTEHKTIIYDFVVDGLSYEYSEDRDKKGRLIDYTLTTYNGDIVRDDNILVTIQDYLERKGY